MHSMHIWGGHLDLANGTFRNLKVLETSHQPPCSTGVLDVVTCFDNLLLYSKIQCKGI